MQYVSTRSRSQVSSPEAVLRGLAPDGGLYMPLSFPKPFDPSALTGLSFTEMASRIFALFLDDFEEIPALAARAFLLASYAMALGQFAVPHSLSATVDGVSMATPLSYLYTGEAMPGYFGLSSMVLGMRPGALGEVSALALLIGGLYLIIRKVISWRIPVSFIGTVALLTLIFGHEGYTRVDFMLYNLCSGGLLLAAIFMATDYATSPVTLKGQLLYGFGCGAITVLIRYFGGYPEGVTYAILLMNLCSWAIDKAFHRHQFGVSKEDIAAEKAAKKAAKEAAK